MKRYYHRESELIVRRPNGWVWNAITVLTALWISAGWQTQAQAQELAIIPQNACCSRTNGACTNIPLSKECITGHTGRCQTPVACFNPSFPCPFFPCPTVSCVDLDPICCAMVGGTPDTTTTCTGPSLIACCMPDGSCQNLTPMNCNSRGGTPGTGSICSGVTQACCTGGGACLEVDNACSCSGTLAGAGTDCTTDIGEISVGALWGDGIPDACDNCMYDNNPFQENTDVTTDPPGDSLGDYCDNCLETANEDQLDCDLDGISVLGGGDACDNCLRCYNPPGMSTGVQPDEDGDGIGDACDNCTPGDPNAICDALNNFCNDTNQRDTDGDGLGDICDDDIDGDDVLNGDDLCDYTPGALKPLVNLSGPLAGTTIFDVDGDCDVDADDVSLMQQIKDGYGGSGIASTLLVSEACGFVPTDVVPPSTAPTVCKTTVYDVCNP